MDGWITCDSVPLCIAVDRLRPCSATEQLAYHSVQSQATTRIPHLRFQRNRGLSMKDTLSAVMPSDELQASDDSLDEDDQDTTTNLPQDARVKHKKSYGRYRPPPFHHSQHRHHHSCLTRHRSSEVDETSKNYRERRRHAEKCFFFCSRKDIVSTKDGFHQENFEQRVRRKTLDCWSCSLDVQAALRETSFNAGVVLSDEEVRLLTESGYNIFIFTVQWVEVDKNAHQRRKNDGSTVLSKYKSRLVRCRNFETTDGLHPDSLAAYLVCTVSCFSWFV